MGKDLYEIGELPPDRRGAATDARAGRPPRALRRARARRSRTRCIDVPELGPRDALVYGDGGRRQLQQRVGGAGRPDRRHEDARRAGASPPTSTSGLRRVRASSTRSAPTSRTSRSATASWSTPASGTPTTRGSRPASDPGARADLPRLGLRHRAGARSRSSRRCRRTSACRRPTHLTWEEAAAPTLTGATAYRMLHGWPPNTVSRAMSSSSGAAPAASARWRSSSCALAGAPGGRRRLERREGRVLRRSSARSGYINRKDFEHWGVPPQWDDAGVEDMVRGREGVRQGDLGRARRERRARRSCSSTPARTRSRPRSSCASAAAWS